MTSAQVQALENEPAIDHKLARPPPIAKTATPQPDSGDVATRWHPSAQACFGCVDWFPYHRLEHGRPASKSLP